LVVDKNQTEAASSTFGTLARSITDANQNVIFLRQDFARKSSGSARNTTLIYDSAHRFGAPVAVGLQQF
jgi:hypothetical protein